MLGGDHSHPGVQLAAWNVTEVGYIYNIYNRYIYIYIYIYIHLSPTYIFTTPILPVGQLSSSGYYDNMSTAWQYLTNMNSYVLVNVIIEAKYSRLD